MKVYYLDNMDCSGVFSSSEKAFENFMTCANRYGYTDIKKDDFDDGSTIFYTWYGFNGESHPRTRADIIEYELDEDNG